MEFETILLTDEDGIARITLNRPAERNAMTPLMGREIVRAVERINETDDIRVCVISGAGKAFSSGANLKTLGKEAGIDSEAETLGGGASFYRLFLSIRSLRVPSIAAVNGHAIGAGFCFALGADLRVVRCGAKLGMTFVNLGIHPGMAATWNLPRLIGPSRAADLLYTGRIISAEEAFQMGIANRIADDDFEEVVEGFANDIATSAPLAVRAVKETLHGTYDRTLEEAIEIEAQRQALTFESEDASEGIQAILAKRKPRFRGR